MSVYLEILVQQQIEGLGLCCIHYDVRNVTDSLPFSLSYCVLQDLTVVFQLLSL